MPDITKITIYKINKDLGVNTKTGKDVYIPKRSIIYTESSKYSIGSVCRIPYNLNDSVFTWSNGSIDKKLMTGLITKIKTITV